MEYKIDGLVDAQEKEKGWCACRGASNAGCFSRCACGLAVLKLPKFPTDATALPGRDPSPSN